MIVVLLTCLPAGIQARINSIIADFIQSSSGRIDFARPRNEEALVRADSVSWRIYKNPLVLYVGGTAAVLLELAEPSIRTALWQHSAFKRDPVGRLRRTALAALVTVYGPRSLAEPMIASVARMHAAIEGTTPSGKKYRADDPALLGWVQATATFSFTESYSRYVTLLDRAATDSAYREGTQASGLYGADDPPLNAAGMQAKFASMHPVLSASPVIFEFLDIMRSAAVLPRYARPLQRLLVRAAVEIVPAIVRQRLGLDRRFGLRPGEHHLVRLLARLTDQILIVDAPAVQSCLRLGLPLTYLYR